MTIPEILVVIAIIGILAALSLPKLLPLITRTKTMEAQAQLRYLAQLEKLNYMIKSNYSTNFVEIGFEQSKLVSQDGTANYQIAIVEATNKGFKATATSVTDFDGDGILNVWEINQDETIKEVTPD